MGKIVPTSAPRVLIKLDTFMPRRFRPVQTQKMTKTEPAMYSLLLASSGSKKYVTVPAIKAMMVGYQTTL